MLLTKSLCSSHSKPYPLYIMFGIWQHLIYVHCSICQQKRWTIHTIPNYKFATIYAIAMGTTLQWSGPFSLPLAYWFFMRVKYEMEVTRRRIYVLVEIAAAFNTEQNGLKRNAAASCYINC